MEIVISTGTRGRYLFQLDSWHLALMASLICLFLITLGIMGYLLSRSEIIAVGMDSGVINAWQQRVHHQEQQVIRIRQQANTQLEMLAKRTAELQADLYKLEGLSTRLVEHLAENTNLDIQQLAYYGNYNMQAQSLGHVMPTDFMHTLDNLGYQLASRAEQLLLLEKLILREDINDAILGITRIVDQGWITSSYGYRTDPFTQRTTMHKGIDISGRAGSQIKSIAAGMVRFSGRRAGYGNLVEIDHGNGFITRYGHNSNNFVTLGDVVNKGQIIAQMGSTGRATGAHVHFEILRNGENLNPLAYIKAAG
jgi:murein DD-endopeptidase MepM/ murein hydrolase activator NlpD